MVECGERTADEDRLYRVSKKAKQVIKVLLNQLRLAVGQFIGPDMDDDILSGDQGAYS